MRALGVVVAVVLLAGCASTRDPALVRAEERIGELEARIAKLEAERPPLIPTIQIPWVWTYPPGDPASLPGFWPAAESVRPSQPR